jgi:hypothetical protein
MGRVAAQSRVVVTHDHRTMRPCAEDRLKTGLSMIGLILVRQTDALGQVIDDLKCSSLSHYRGRVERDNCFPAGLVRNNFEWKTRQKNKPVVRDT